MAKTLQQRNIPSLKAFRVMDLAILLFSLIFVVDVIFYFGLDGSLRDFVVMMFSLYMAIVTLTARLRFQPEIGRQIILEWIAVSIVGIVFCIFFVFFFTL